MKKICLIFSIICILLLPSVFAENYTVDDFNIDFNNEWYVFTKDNLNENENLNYLNLNKDTLLDYFENNNIDLNAIKYLNEEKSLQIVVRILDFEETDKSEYKYDIYDLKDFSDTELESMALSFAKTRQGAIPGKTLTTNSAKYYTVSYTMDGYNILEYVTIVNGKAFVFGIQTDVSFDDNKDEILNIINSIKFNRIPNKTDEIYITIGIITIVVMLLLPIIWKIRNKNVSKLKRNIGIILLIIQLMSLIGRYAGGTLDDLFRVYDISTFAYLIGTLSFGIAGNILIIISYKKKSNIDIGTDKIKKREVEKTNNIDEQLEEASEINEKHRTKKEGVENYQKGTKKQIYDNEIDDTESSSIKSNIIGNKIICGKCNTKNGINREYCYMCGNLLLMEEKNNQKYCTNCGKAISEESKYCNHCGYRLLN